LSDEKPGSKPPRKRIKIGRFSIPVPRSRPLRIALGIALVVFGILGFLPVLGFWMIPLGLVVLSIDFPIARRWKRKFEAWWNRRKKRK
jgi:hypothetical protein